MKWSHEKSDLQANIIITGYRTKIYNARYMCQLMKMQKV